MTHRFTRVGSGRNVPARRWSLFSRRTGKLLVFLAVLLVPAAPASAIGPRDAVIAGMFRCATVGDARVWLDCFYGAAQPMRAALGLPPVLPAQAQLARNPPAGSQSGDQGPRYQATSAALGCNTIAQDRPWLDCYYAAAQSVRAQLGLSPAAQMRPPPPAQTAGTIAPSQAGSGVMAHVGFPVASRMASYSFDHYGLFTIVLANGQTWRQLSGDTSFARWTKPAPGYTVRISRGALHSFNLKVMGISSEYKVERIN